MATQLSQVEQYFLLLEQFSVDGAAFGALLHAEFRQREFANLLNRSGQESDLADLLRRAALGKQMLSQQSLAITNAVEAGEQLVVEALWQGTVAVDAGPLKAGQSLKAHFCIVLEFKEGKIYRQRNYDCFEPF